MILRRIKKIEGDFYFETKGWKSESKTSKGKLVGKYKRMATLKQKKAAELVANHLLGNYGKGGGEKKKLVGSKILQEAGYGKGIQQNPQLVFGSEGFIKLMEAMGFTDEELLRVHKELLHSIDDRIRLEAMKEGYRLKDKYPSTKLKIGRLEEIEEILTETDIKDNK